MVFMAITVSYSYYQPPQQTQFEPACKKQEILYKAKGSMCSSSETSTSDILSSFSQNWLTQKWSKKTIFTDYWINREWLVGSWWLLWGAHLLSLLDMAPANQSELLVDSSGQGNLLTDAGTRWDQKRNSDGVLIKIIKNKPNFVKGRKNVHPKWEN